jgi:hypothetical protein
LFEFYRAAQDQILEAGTFEKFHSHKETAILLANVVNCADIG